MLKFTFDQVREIRNRLNNGEPASHIAKELKVDPSTITRIKNKNVWTSPHSLTRGLYCLSWRFEGEEKVWDKRFGTKNKMIQYINKHRLNTHPDIIFISLIDPEGENLIAEE